MLPRCPQLSRFRTDIFFRLVLVFLLASGCGSPSPKDAPKDFSSLPSLEPEIALARTRISPVALRYLETALDTIQTLHPIGQRFDWQEWRLAALERAHDSEQPFETYQSLTEALTELPGSHPFFKAPDSTEVNGAEPSFNRKYLLSEAIEQLYVGRIGQDIVRINVPRFIPQDPESSNSFASTILSRILEIERQNLCGWVVDLRQNTGGNMWPMIAGLGIILGEGQVGSFVDVKGIKTLWIQERGTARMDSVMLAHAEGSYSQRNETKPVAVLIGKRTGSSGEAVAVAFKGREKTRFFGNPTAGATSSPTRLRLSDGAVIGFASVLFADREGTIYSEPIVPDELITPAETEGVDLTLDSAEKWLRKQSSCKVN